MTPLESYNQIIPTVEVLSDSMAWQYQIVVLRDDQLELIRQIVREEIAASR